MAKEHLKVDGIELDFDNSLMGDIDMLEAYADMQDGDILKAITVARGFFGDDWPRIKRELNAQHEGHASYVHLLMFLNQVVIESAADKEAPKNSIS